MIPSPAELSYFVEVANTQNISRAAERLGISQPTLSLAIQRIERSFGVPLLIRSKAGVKLTPGGRKLLSQARNLLEEWDRIRGDALKDESQISGRYTIGCHTSVALYSLPEFLPELIEENPALEIKLMHDLSRKITEDVISFKIDFGIVVNPTEHPDLVIKLLCKDEVSLWTALNPSRLQEEDAEDAVLICDPDLLQTQAIMKLLSRHEKSFKRVLTSSNLEVITSLVAAGAGVGILPARVATRIPSQGLRPFDKSAPSFHDRICLVYRADAQKSKASRHIAKAIEKHLGARGSA